MQNRKISFKIKVLIPIITVFILSISTISVISYRLLESIVITKTNNNLNIYTDSILAHINHLKIILDNTKQMLNENHIAIAKSIANLVDSVTISMTSEELQKLAEPLDILEINIANSNGIIINSNIKEYIGFDYKSGETTVMYMGLVDGTVSEIGEEPRKSVLEDQVIESINHYTGVPRKDMSGFIQLGFDAGILSRLQEEIDIEMAIKETKLGNNGYGMVLSDGLISAHPVIEMKGTDVSSKEWYNIVRYGNGFTWIEIDDIKYYAGYKNENGNTVIGLVPEYDYYYELKMVFNETVLLVILAIIIIIAVVYLFLWRLLLPIKTLSKGLGKIAEGDLDARIEGRYNDEFDEIKDAVNKMAVGIKTYLNDKLCAERAAYESEIAKCRADTARETVISSIEYASKIQKNLLPPEKLFEEAFLDYSYIWKPKDIVGGDIYWIKNFSEGTVLCVCDCTGHGTPGALLTMLVVSTFEANITDSNYKDTADIIWELEQSLVSALNVETFDAGERGLTINDGCDLAVLYIAKDGSVTISSGNMHVYVCDSSAVTRHRGQRIRVGDGSLKSKEHIKVMTIPANKNNKFYIASDGLYEQIGGDERIPFGYDTFEKIILENHNEKQQVISDKVWQAFEEYRNGNIRRDDFQLITFKPFTKL